MHVIKLSTLTGNVQHPHSLLLTGDQMFYKAIRVYVEQDESSFVWIAVLLTQMLIILLLLYAAIYSR